MRELKQQLRRELIEQRRAMDFEHKTAFDKDIFNKIKPYLDISSSVFTYASTEIEVDTRRIIAYCLEKGIPTALPVSGENELSFFFIKSPNELKKGKFCIDEPPRAFPAKADEKTLCIVPALCADGQGSRLGYGRGYYDRFLNDFSGTSVILCYKDFMREVPTEPHDFKADITIFNS